MKKRISSILALSALLLLAGCSSGNNKSSDNNAAGSDTASAEKVEIRFATWDSESTLQRQEDLVNEFNESQDEIFVNLEAYGGEYDTKITAGIGAGDAPDVMYMWNYPAYYEALEPLDSYIESEGEDYKDNFYETLWNYNSIDEVVYGIPVGFSTHVVYYNKDIFDQQGVEVPDDNWTWEDLHKLALELTNEDENITGFGIPMKPDPYDFEMYLWGNETAYVDENSDVQGNLNSDASIEVFEHFQEMLEDGSAVATEGSGSTEFEGGNIAMLVNASWMQTPLNEAGINFGTLEIPNRNGIPSVSILSSSGLAMSANSEHKDAAFEFIKFWTNEEANQSRIDYELPVLKTVVEENDLESDETVSTFYDMLVRSEDYISSSFIYENWSDLSSDIQLAIERMFNPTTVEEPSSVLNEIAEKY